MSVSRTPKPAGKLLAKVAVEQVSQSGKLVDNTSLNLNKNHIAPTYIHELPSNKLAKGMWKAALVLLVAVFILIIVFPRKPVAPYATQEKRSKEHVIGNISYGDTLFLYAGYSECGEWGGHRELLKVYLSDEGGVRKRTGYVEFRKRPFTADFFLDTIGCSYRPDRRYFLKKQKVLSADDEKAIVQYIHVLLDYSLKELRPSHAGNVYWVGRENEKPQIWFYDTQYGWDGFKTLREKLFSTSSTRLK